MAVDFRVLNKPVRDVIIDIARNARVSHLNVVQYDTEKGYSDRKTKQVDLVGLAEFEKMSLEDSQSSVALGISSLVRLDSGRFGHLYLLDSDGVNACDIPKLTGFLENYANGKSFGTRGFVVGSGSGLHLYSHGVTDHEDWKSYMRQLVKGSAIVDSRYAELSLERGFGTLRLNATSEKPVRPSTVLSYQLTK